MGKLAHLLITALSIYLAVEGLQIRSLFKQLLAMMIRRWFSVDQNHVNFVLTDSHASITEKANLRLTEFQQTRVH